ncbi:lovastatin nonaketide synthase [Nemania abortiva]|nr:lovastatin nonaketide synthase [Nemania abortiva]
METGKPELTPLAIIGLAFEFPQDETSERRFWELISEGRSTYTKFPPERLGIDAYYHPDPSRPGNIPVRGGHFIAGNLGAFDAPFFNITPGEAACMDVQHRHMLETAYHALEDAGIPINKCSGSDTAVFTGCFSNDYAELLQADLEAEQRHAALGVSAAMLANRISWFFNFTGTSLNLDTACSSSLVALHLACQDLRAGNCSMALVGGANLVFHPNFMNLFTDGNFLGKDGRSWSFDQRANGYGRGDGHAVLVVKRMADAVRDGDTIRAVIRNSASNQDGRTPGITVPSADAQSILIKRVFRQGNLDMGPTRFFEAHGTGTPIGDPIEANAIGSAFQDYRSANDPLYIGAVKANIGHLEGASGLAGVIKTILVLEKGIIPPIANLEHLNSKIDADRLHLVFPREVAVWPTPGLRRACVNSFGFGGTNAVVVLDDAYHYIQARGLTAFHRTSSTLPHVNVPIMAIPATNGIVDIQKGPDGKSHSTRPILLVWSGADQDALQTLSNAYRQRLEARRNASEWDVRDLNYTLAKRRSHLAWRSWAIATESGGPRDSPLALVYPFRPPAKALTGDMARIAFAFTGQGAQYLGMGRQLTSFTVFLDSLVTSERYLKMLGCPWSVVDTIRAHDLDDSFSIESPEYSQPLTTALQIALVDLLAACGVHPSIVIGHSSGEVAAAYACGGLSHLSAIKVAYYRGTLSARLAAATIAQGQSTLGMTAVGLSRHEVQPFLDRLGEGAMIGCVNSPKSVTLTGEVTQLSKLEQILRADRIFARRLRVPLAYHSRFMTEIADDYLAALGDVLGKRDNGADLAPMVSSVTGDIIDSNALAQGSYWVRNLTSTVHFESAFSKLVRQDEKLRQQLGGQFPAADLRVTHVLEVGPHSALQGPIRECLQSLVPKTGTASQLVYIPSLIRGRDSAVALLEAAGELYCAGFPVDLLRINGLGETPRPAPLDLPPYPFNHSESHWREPRFSKNLRFPLAPRHDLIGMPSLDWNPHVAQWRNVIRIAEVPWLVDHTLAGMVVVPAATMVTMAIEAFKQLQSSFLGLQIQDINFSHAMAFSSGQDSIEIQLNLITPPKSLGQSSAQFRLFLMESGSWIECCNGSIRAVTSVQDRDRILQSGPWLDGQGTSPAKWLYRITKICQSIEQDIYIDQDPNGIVWGPCFQNIQQARFDTGGRVVALLDPESWKARAVDGMPHPSYVVHPSTIDGLIQLLRPAIRIIKENQVLPAMMPTRIQSLWVSCEVPELPQGKLTTAGVFQLRGYRGGGGDVVAISEETQTPFLVVTGLEATFVGSDDPGSSQLPLTAESPPLCHRLESRPDISIMTSGQLLAYCAYDRPQREDKATSAYHEQAIAVVAFIKDALDFLNSNKIINLKGHIEKYFVPWMHHQLQLVRAGKFYVNEQSLESLLSNTEYREQLIERVEGSGPNGLLYMTLGRNLIDILSGAIDPLNFIGQNWRLAGGCYEEALAADHDSYPACRFASLMSFKNPSMKILELGAGTGRTTSGLLQAMSSGGLMRWSTYDCTDISPAFLPAVRAKFHSYSGHISFATCDISQDPITQSFTPGGYDLVIASQILHLTIDIDQVLLNVRKLLKPGGKLLLIETTLPDTAVQTGFTFGLLEDWWSPLERGGRLGSTTRSPYLTTELWDERLRISGFSGVDFEISRQDNVDIRQSSMIISTAIHGRSVDEKAMTPRQVQPEIRIILDDKYHCQTIVAEFIQSICSESCISCTVHTIDRFPDAPSSSSTTTIVLLELDSVFLYGISSANYKYLHSALFNSNSVLWVTRSTAARGAYEEPRHHLADGLGRVLMSEDSTFKFSTLGLTEFDRDPEQVAEIISRLAHHVAECPVQNLETSWVFSARDGLFHIFRVTESSSMDTIIKNTLSTSHLQQVRPAVDNVPPLSLSVNAPGQPDSTLEWREVADEPRSLQEDEVRIQVRAVGLTRKDRMITAGQLNESTEIGSEIAGVVIAAGKQSGHSVGDHVFTALSSSCRSTMTLRGDTAIQMLSHMSFETAASLPRALWLAYHSLVNVARVCPGETVLVFLGLSDVGQIAVQIARKLGAKVLVTARYAEEEARLLPETHHVSENDILPTDDGAFLGHLLERTEGRGVDVVVGTLADEETSGDLFAHGLAVCGRVVDISVQAGPWRLFGGSRGAASNIMTASVRIDELLKNAPEMAYNTLRSAVKFALAEQLTAPQPIHVTRGSDLSRAITDLQSNDIVGKRVIQLDQENDFAANMITRPKHPFVANATYIVVGGFGGIGRGIVRWMASRGARNLMILSRSGAKSGRARTLMAKLEKDGVRIQAPITDISDLDSLRRTISELAEVMPPIRGCIQAAVIVRDNLWRNMTYHDWHVSLGAKATGSWNLHAVLPPNLDFFILISSISSLFGNRGQANYSAGNAFKDALAHHRIAHGQKAVSINLGLMVDEGFVAETATVEVILRRLQLMKELHMTEFLALLEHYCDPALPLLPDSQAQVVFGIELPSVVMAKLKGEDLHHSIYRPIFSHLFAMGRGSGTAEDPSKAAVGRISREAALRATETEDEAGSLVTGWLRAKIAHVLGLTVEDVDTGRPIHTFGIDSLVALDLMNWFNREVGAEVQVFMLLGNTPMEELARDAARRSRFLGVAEFQKKP